jgi:diacylglycerol diphosphate phosphatase/phosphatidate phosphatase
MDYRHHWQDIFVGMLIGAATSYFSYRQYYPSLEHPLSHKPYSPRHSRAVTGAEQPGPHPHSGGVKGQTTGDLESGAGASGVHETDELERELEGTVPRGEHPALERVWSEDNENETRRRKGGKAVSAGRASADHSGVLSA